MLKEIKEEETLDKLGNSIESILGIKESWYKFILVDTSDGKASDDFTMPPGMGIGGGGSILSQLMENCGVNI